MTSNADDVPHSASAAPRRLKLFGTKANGNAPSSAAVSTEETLLPSAMAPRVPGGIFDAETAGAPFGLTTSNSTPSALGGGGGGNLPGHSDWELTAACRHLCAVARRCDAGLGGYHAAAAATVTPAQARRLQQSDQTSAQSWDWPLQFDDATVGAAGLSDGASSSGAVATASGSGTSNLSHAQSTYRRFCPTTFQCAASQFASGGRLPGLGGGGHTQIRASLDRIYRGLPGPLGTCGFGIGLPVPAYTFPHGGAHHASHQSAVALHGSALPESAEVFRYAAWLAELDRVVGFMRPPQIAAALAGRRQRSGEAGAGIDYYNDTTEVGERIRFEEAMAEVVMRSWAEEYQRQGCPTALPATSTFVAAATGGAAASVPVAAAPVVASTTPSTAAAAAAAADAAANLGAHGESMLTLWALLTRVMPVPGTLVDGLALPHFLPLGRPWPAPPAAAASSSNAAAATAFRSFFADGSTGGSDLLEAFVVRFMRYRRDERQRATSSAHRLRHGVNRSPTIESALEPYRDAEVESRHLIADGALALRVACCLMRLDRDPACGRFRHSVHLERGIELALLSPSPNVSGGGRSMPGHSNHHPSSLGMQQLIDLQPRVGPMTRAQLRQSPAIGGVFMGLVSGHSAGAGGSGGVPASPVATGGSPGSATGVVLPVTTEAPWTLLDARRALFPAVSAALSESAAAGMRFVDGMMTAEYAVFAYPVSDVQGPQYASTIFAATKRDPLLTPTSIATLHAALRYGLCVLDPMLAAAALPQTVPVARRGGGAGAGVKSTTSAAKAFSFGSLVPSTTSSGTSGGGSAATGAGIYSSDHPPVALADALRQIIACSRAYNGPSPASKITAQAEALVSEQQRKIRLVIKNDFDSIALTAWYERRPPAFNFIPTAPAVATSSASVSTTATTGGTSAASARRRPRSGDVGEEVEEAVAQQLQENAAARKTRATKSRGGQGKGVPDGTGAEAVDAAVLGRRKPRGKKAVTAVSDDDAASAPTSDSETDNSDVSVVSDSSDSDDSDAAPKSRRQGRGRKDAAGDKKTPTTTRSRKAAITENHSVDAAVSRTGKRAAASRQSGLAANRSATSLEKMGAELDRVRLELHNARSALEAVAGLGGGAPNAAPPSDEELDLRIAQMRSMLECAERIAEELA